MKKWLLVTLATGILATPWAWAAPIQVTVNGNPVPFDQPPIEVGGRVLVPVRGVFQSLGANVTWNPGTRTVTAIRGQDLVVLPLGSRTAQVDGQNKFLDQPAQIIGGRTLVPLRFISEALGAQVTWIAAESLVQVTSGLPQAYNPPPPPQPEYDEYSYPLVTSMSTNGTGPLFDGQGLEVTMYGDPGGQAAFAVGGRPPQPMNEVQPGTYQGQYTVHRGDDNPYAVVTGTLRMPDGEQEAIHAPRPVAVYGFIPRPVRYYGEGFAFHEVVFSSYNMWLGNSIRLTFQGPPGGSGFFNLGGQQIPVIEERPGFYYANYAPPPNYQPGVVPVLVSFQPRGGAPQEALMQRPITLMPSNLRQGQLASNPQIAPPSAPGQPVRVRMTAAPGSQATFNVGPHQNIPMQEVSPGQFEGVFTPRPGQNLSNAAVSAHVGQQGGQAATVQAPTPVSVTAPPRRHASPVANNPNNPPPPPPRNPGQPPPPPPRNPVQPPPPPPVRTPSTVAVNNPPVAQTLRLHAVQVQAAPQLSPGQEVQVVAQGDPGGRATFDIGNRRNLPMQEGPRGQYHGNYRVAGDDHFRNQEVVVHLASANNQVASQAGPQRLTVAEAVAPPPRQPEPKEEPRHPEAVKLELARVETNARAFHVGETVVITAHGSPHGRATVELGGQPLPMKETEPGTYVGEFRVNPSQRPGEVPVRVVLTNGPETVNKEAGAIRIEAAAHR